MPMTTFLGYDILDSCLVDALSPLCAFLEQVSFGDDTDKIAFSITDWHSPDFVIDQLADGCFDGIIRTCSDKLTPLHLEASPDIGR